MTAMRRLHISNAGARNAVIAASSVQPPAPPRMGKSGQTATFRRYVAAGEGTLDADLTARLGDDYAQALIDDDPEIAFDVVGRFIDTTQTVLVTEAGEPLFAAPQIVEISYGPDGTELERKEPSETPATVTDALPARWTGRTMPTGEVVRKFAFKRTLQLQHVDGVTFDFLYAMAKELSEGGVMVLLGAGDKGKDPLILQLNGSPYRGFLEGRVDGERYILLLHLSNMELKRPTAKAADGEPS